MTAEDTFVKIASISKITKADIDGLVLLDPQTLAVVMQTYIDNEVVADHGIWVKIGNFLKEAAPYVGIAGAILSVATPLAKIVGL